MHLGPSLWPRTSRDELLDDLVADDPARPLPACSSSSPSFLGPPPNLHAPSTRARPSPRHSRPDRFIIKTYKLEESTTFDNAIANAIKKGSVSGAFELPKGLSGKVKIAKPAAAAGKEVGLPSHGCVCIAARCFGCWSGTSAPSDASECVPVTRSRATLAHATRSFPQNAVPAAKKVCVVSLSG